MTALKQLNIFEINRLYPNSPGWKARATSKRAASAARGRKTEVQNRILVLLRARPMTADEIAEHLGESILYIRPRVTELSMLDRIEDSGERRKNISGQSAIVWRVKA